MFLFLVSRVSEVDARQLLQTMDATLYGAGRVHVSSGQAQLDMLRSSIERIAYPKR